MQIDGVIFLTRRGGKRVRQSQREIGCHMEIEKEFWKKSRYETFEILIVQYGDSKGSEVGEV